MTTKAAARFVTTCKPIWAFDVLASCLMDGSRPPSSALRALLEDNLALRDDIAEVIDAWHTQTLLDAEFEGPVQ